METISWVVVCEGDWHVLVEPCEWWYAAFVLCNFESNNGKSRFDVQGTTVAANN